MVPMEVALIAVTTMLEAGFRHYISEAGSEGLPAYKALLGVSASLTIMLGAGMSMNALTGWKQWLTRVVPIAVALAIREFALGLLGTCCKGLVPTYSSASLLVLTIPLLYAMRGKSSVSSLFALMASLLLFFIEYDGETVCRPACLVHVFLASVSLSVAVVLLHAHGGETEGGSLPPALMLVALLSLGHAHSNPVPLVPSILQSVNRVVLFMFIVKVGRLSAPLTDVYFAAIGGSCIPWAFGAPTPRLLLLVLCGCLCVIQLLLRFGEQEKTKRGRFYSMLAIAAFLVIAGTPVYRLRESEKEIIAFREKDIPTSRLVSGVIVYMDSKRKPIEKALVLVQKHFLSCWPYPVHVFKEGVTQEYKDKVQSITTSEVSFTEIGHFFDIPPNNISMATANYWINVRKYGRGHHFGYRMMCRFFSGIFAQYEFLKKYDYYWRLDTDSWIREPILIDPFRHMAVHGCRYGHMSRLRGDAADVVLRLHETVLEWADETGVPRGNVTRMNAHVSDMSGRYKRAMYYNNFELASVQWITGDAYTSFFNYLDFTDGFMKYRWGDAPVRTLAVHLMLDDHEVCDFERFVPYHHGYFTNKVYSKDDHKRPTCPATLMEKEGRHYVSPPRYKQG